MPGLPARCTRCGRVFEGHAIHIAAGATIEGLELENNIEGCPYCGGVARVIEGTLSIRDGVVGVLDDAVVDPGLWQLLIDLTAQAREGAISPEEAVQEMAEKSPAVKSLLGRAPPALRKVLVQVLIGAITILAGQEWAELHDHAATHADAERIEQIEQRQAREMPSEVQTAVERAIQEYYVQPRGDSPTVRADKVGRNDPCPCGSGLKHKKCCGR